MHTICLLRAGGQNPIFHSVPFCLVCMERCDKEQYCVCCAPGQLHVPAEGYKVLETLLVSAECWKLGKAWVPCTPGCWQLYAVQSLQCCSQKPQRTILAMVNWMGRLRCVWEVAHKSAVLFLCLLEFREKWGGSWRYVLHLGNSSNAENWWWWLHCLHLIQETPNLMEVP